jgi:chromate reductase, NAD(P)H dehydrogenase (quinone)
VAIQVRLLLVSGSTRATSTNTAALRTAHAVFAENITTALYDRLADLPAFNPDDDRDPLPPVVADLREQIAAADGVVFCTPEYAGALPGSFKNLLDWTVGGAEMYGKPSAWINVAAEGRGMSAHASLKTVLDYVGAAIVEPACARVVVARDALGHDGLIVSTEIRAAIDTALRALADHVSTTHSAVDKGIAICPSTFRSTVCSRPTSRSVTWTERSRSTAMSSA